MTPEGKSKWKYTWPNAGFLFSSPVVSKDGTNYIGTNQTFDLVNKVLDPGVLLAIHPDGTLKWSMDDDIHPLSTPIIGANGILYVGGRQLTNVAISIKDTEILWEKTFDQQFSFTTPAIGTREALYFSSFAVDNSKQSYLYMVK